MEIAIYPLNEAQSDQLCGADAVLQVFKKCLAVERV